MKNLKATLTILVAALAIMFIGAEAAHNTDIVPNGEVDLVPISLANTSDSTLTFSTAANFVQTIPTNANVTLLLIKSDGDFYEGQATTDSTKNVLREANVWHQIAVSGRTAWHFRAVSATTTIKGKLLTGS